MGSDKKCKFDSGSQRKTAKIQVTKLNDYLRKRAYEIQRKNLENKEINGQLTNFSYLIFEMGIFTGIIAN